MINPTTTTPPSSTPGADAPPPPLPRRLDPKEVAVAQGPRAKDVAAVETILADVAARGDDAVVESARKFDDENFSAEQIRVTRDEMKSAAGRVVPEVMAALRRAI